MFVLIHNNFIITTHTASMWLTVVLALFRYVAVCRPHSVALQLASLSRVLVCLYNSQVCRWSQCGSATGQSVTGSSGSRFSPISLALQLASLSRVSMWLCNSPACHGLVLQSL